MWMIQAIRWATCRYQRLYPSQRWVSEASPEFLRVDDDDDLTRMTTMTAGDDDDDDDDDGDDIVVRIQDDAWVFVTDALMMIAQHLSIRSKIFRWWLEKVWLAVSFLIIAAAPGNCALIVWKWLTFRATRVWLLTSTHGHKDSVWNLSLLVGNS